jgi:hypothetical protein
MAKEELKFYFPLILVSAAALAAIILMLGYGRPPQLPFDGQNSVVGVAYTAIGQLPPNFSPPWNVFTLDPFLSVDTGAVSGGMVNVTVRAEQTGMIFYKKFYIYQNVSGSYWLLKYFPDTPITGTNWIADSATMTVTMNTSQLSAENYVLVYACTRDTGQWRCGCRSAVDTTCKNWSLQNYSLPATTPSQYACTGTPPANATLCAGDDAGLTQDTAVSLVAACTAAKCEYTCNAPSYFLNGTKCSLNTSSCDTTTCPGRTVGQNFCGADLTKVYVCTAASASCLILNANACGNGKSCQNATGTAICQPCAATTPAASSIACGQNATGVLCSNNQPYSVNGTSCTSGTCTPSGGTWSCTGGCTPNCVGKQCGSDGCGGSCGSCTSPATCNTAGQCAVQCTDQCTTLGSLTCGVDQCPGANVGINCNAVLECKQQSWGCKAWQAKTVCALGQTCDPKTLSCTTSGTPDTDLTICLNTTDATPKTANPPTQYAGDWGIAYIDPWPAGAQGTGKCCGDNANEYLLYSEGNQNYKSCCNDVKDCVDTSGTCYTHNQLYNGVTTGAGQSGSLFCYYDWWYTCDANSVCAAHKAGMVTNYECYYNTKTGQYQWLPYSNAEICGAGIDYDCDNIVDECQGTAAFVSPTTSLGQNYTFQVTGGPAGVAGDLFKNSDGSSVYTQTTSWLATDASGNAVKGPWTCSLPYKDYVYILWPNGKTTNIATHECK